MNRLIDRRLNARGKSTVNRERFLRRYKTQIRAEVKRMVGELETSFREVVGRAA